MKETRDRCEGLSPRGSLKGMGFPTSRVLGDSLGAVPGIGHQFPGTEGPQIDGSILALGGAVKAKLRENSAVPARFERATCGSEDRCSIH